MVCIIHQHESAIGIHEFPPKYVEIKQHNSEQPVDQRRNQKGNLKYLKPNENGNTTYHNLWDIAKQLYGGGFFLNLLPLIDLVYKLYIPACVIPALQGAGRTSVLA